MYVSETVVHHKVKPGHSQVAGDQIQDCTDPGGQVESPVVKGAGNSAVNFYLSGYNCF